MTNYLHKTALIGSLLSLFACTAVKTEHHITLDHNITINNSIDSVLISPNASVDPIISQPIVNGDIGSKGYSEAMAVFAELLNNGASEEEIFDTLSEYIKNGTVDGEVNIGD